MLNGRYGPYITDKQRNARMPKDRDPKTLTLEECRALLAAAPLRPARGRFGRRGRRAGARQGHSRGASRRSRVDASLRGGKGAEEGRGEEEGRGREAGAAAAVPKKKAAARKKAATAKPVRAATAATAAKTARSD